MSIRDRFGWPSYNIPDREPDFKLMLHDTDDNLCEVSYWIENFTNIKDFKLLYGWDNNNFKDKLGMIFTENNGLKWRFEEGKESRHLEEHHLNRILEKLEEYVTKTVEEGLLGDY